MHNKGTAFSGLAAKPYASFVKLHDLLHITQTYSESVCFYVCICPLKLFENPVLIGLIQPKAIVFDRNTNVCVFPVSTQFDKQLLSGIFNSIVYQIGKALK